MKLASTLLAAVLLTPSLQADQPGLIVGFSEAQVQTIVGTAQSSFWDKAVGEDGKHFVPESDAERASVLIPVPDANRVVREAHFYGLALWCGLEWKQTYLSYMQAERRRNWSQKQIAFIGLLFGVAQGAVPNWMGRECSAAERESTAGKLADEAKRLKAGH